MHRNSTLSRIALAGQERKVIPKRRLQLAATRSIDPSSTVPFPPLSVFIKIPRDSPCVPSRFLTVCRSPAHAGQREIDTSRYRAIVVVIVILMPRYGDLPPMTSLATNSARVNSALPLESFACMLIDRRRCCCLLHTLLLIHNTLCSTKTHACAPFCGSHCDFAARNTRSVCKVRFRWNDP